MAILGSGIYITFLSKHDGYKYNNNNINGRDYLYFHHYLPKHLFSSDTIKSPTFLKSIFHKWLKLRWKPQSSGSKLQGNHWVENSWAWCQLTHFAQQHQTRINNHSLSTHAHAHTHIHKHTQTEGELFYTFSFVWICMRKRIGRRTCSWTHGYVCSSVRKWEHERNGNLTRLFLWACAHVHAGYNESRAWRRRRRGGEIATAARVKTNQHKQRDDT